MLVQIYGTSTPEETRALADIGFDHIGVLVGDGSFPREDSIDEARVILSAIPSRSKGTALLLSADVPLIDHIISELNLQLCTSAHPPIYSPRPLCKNSKSGTEL